MTGFHCWSIAVVFVLCLCFCWDAHAQSRDVCILEFQRTGEGGLIPSSSLNRYVSRLFVHGQNVSTGKSVHRLQQGDPPSFWCRTSRRGRGKGKGKQNAVKSVLRRSGKQGPRGGDEVRTREKKKDVGPTLHHQKRFPPRLLDPSWNHPPVVSRSGTLTLEMHQNSLSARMHRGFGHGHAPWPEGRERRCA